MKRVVASILVVCLCSFLEAVALDDLKTIPQDAGSFVQNLKESPDILEIQKSYKSSYFSPWNMERPEESLDDISWPFLSFKVGKSYGINLQLLKEEFFIEMYNNYNFDEYLSVSKKAITLKYTHLRALPTDRPIYRDPQKAGEGFPFDYAQNSSIAANKPLFVSHYSKDREWVMVFSSFTYGWMKSDELTFIDDACAQKYQNSPHIFLLKNGIPIHDMHGKFLFDSRVGMLLKLLSEDKENYTVVVITNQKSPSTYIKALIPKNIASKNVLRLSRDNFESIMAEFVGTPYDWGGRYGDRDCSSLLRDMFLPFGIWLPRNSSHQSKVGKIISLKGLSDREKIKLIKEKALPFETILYRRGHVLLYVGTYKGRVVVFHDVWGIRTKIDGVKGRIIVGKALFSTLLLGQEQEGYDIHNGHLRNIISMGIITKDSE